MANGEIKMNSTFKNSSNQTNNLSWKEAYAMALANGASLESLLEQLEDELKITECRLFYNNEEIDKIDTLEQQAKMQIGYPERQNYLNTLIIARDDLQHRK